MRFAFLSAIGFAAGLYAQPMTCQRVDTPVTTLRAEAVADLLSEVLISCTGGAPANSGSAITPYQLLVTSNTPFANLPFSTPQSTPVLPYNGALLILDDAAPAAQVACVPTGTASTCSEAAGAAGNPNVFQGTTLQNNVVLFQGIPINPPGAGKTRTIRITNLRVASSQIPATPAPAQVMLQTEIFDPNGNTLGVANSSQVAGIPQPSYQFAVRTATDGAVTAPNPALLATPSMLPMPAAGSNLNFNLKFTENFAGAFKRRNLGTSNANPSLVVSQANAAVNANTETGFYNSLFPTDNGLNAAGLADSGTRFLVTFTNIPNNVFLLVSSRDVNPGTTNYSATVPRALLTYSDANGAGAFSQNRPAYANYSLIEPFNGTATLAWEVVVTDPTQVEAISFNVAIVAPNGVPSLGTGLVQGMLAPVYPGVPVQGTNGQPVAETLLFPSFVVNPAVAVPAFTLVPSLSVSNLTSVSAASYNAAVLAPDSIVAAFGPGLAPSTQTAGGNLPTTLNGISVNIIDNSGTSYNPQLYLVSQNQVNFVMNDGIASGEAVVSVINDGQAVATGFIQVAPVAPALFSANGSGQGTAAGLAVQTTNGSTVSTPLANYSAQQGTFTPFAIDVTTSTSLTLYATGIRGRSSLANVSLTAGGVSVPVTFAGADKQAVGLDDLIAGPLPASLAGKGDVPLQLSVDGNIGNLVTIRIK